jgi:phage RecT family recombinase
MAKNNTELNQQLAKSAQVMGQSALAEKPKQVTINSLLEKTLPEVEKALIGSGHDATRLVRIFTSLIKNNKKLSEIAIVNSTSVLSACLDIAAYGLDPSLPNEVFIVPYGNEAKAQLGYKGLAKLAHRAAKEAGRPLVKFEAQLVYDTDTYVRNIEPFKLIHKRDDFGTLGELKGGYAHAVDKYGTHYFFVMSVQQAEDHQKRFTKAAKYESSPFYGGIKSPNFKAYLLKTVVRGMCKNMAMSNNQLASAIVNDIDEQSDSDFHGAMKIKPREDDIEIPTKKEETQNDKSKNWDEDISEVWQPEQVSTDGEDWSGGEESTES